MSRSQRNSRRQDLDRGVRPEAECVWGVSGDEAGIVPLFQFQFMLFFEMMRSSDDALGPPPLAYLFPARLAPSNIRIIAGAIVVIQESIEKSP